MFPQRSHKTCGGVPRRPTSSTKSSSFVKTTLAPSEPCRISPGLPPLAGPDRERASHPSRTAGESSDKYVVRCGRPPTGSRENHSMADAATRKPQASVDVLKLEIRMLSHDLLRRHPGSEKLQHVRYANPHAANARTPTALPRVDGDPIHQLRHACPLAQEGVEAERLALMRGPLRAVACSGWFGPASRPQSLITTHAAHRALEVPEELDDPAVCHRGRENIESSRSRQPVAPCGNDQPRTRTDTRPGESGEESVGALSTPAQFVIAQHLPVSLLLFVLVRCVQLPLGHCLTQFAVGL